MTTKRQFKMQARLTRSKANRGHRRAVRQQLRRTKGHA